MEEDEKGKEAKIETAKQSSLPLQQQIWSWGAGTDGQLGTGKLEDECLPQLLHLSFLTSFEPISTFACGGAHVIALTYGGRVFTWGRGASGQLGHGEMVNCLEPKPVTFFDGYVITHVSAGWSHSGFVSDTGYVFTSGDGSFGQLGHGDYSSHGTPFKVSYFANKHVEQIACGMRHSLVLLKDSSGNQVYGFGSGKRGQLGFSGGKIRSVCIPQVISGFEDVNIASISANGDHSAALSADGHLYTWGRGFAAASDANSPHGFLSSMRITKVALGWNHALVLTSNREVFMLGGNHHGALSNLEKMKQNCDTKECVLDRVSSLDGVEVVQIAAGAEHSVLVTGDGVIKTWGWGEHGQLGLGNTSDQTTPQAVSLGQESPNEKLISKVFCGSGFTYVTAAVSPIEPQT